MTPVAERRGRGIAVVTWLLSLGSRRGRFGPPGGARIGK